MDTYIYSLGSLIWCGLTGFFVGIGITYFVLRTITRRRGAFWARQISNLPDPLPVLVNVLMYGAIKGNMTSIVFGRPTETAGPLPASTPPAASSALAEIPVWYCAEGKCQDTQPPLPVRLLFPVIGELQSHAQEGMRVSDFADNCYQVIYSVGMKENFCYYVKIESVKKL